MLIFLEHIHTINQIMFNQQFESSPSKRTDSIGTLFFKLGPKSFITYVRFTQKKGNNINKFIERLDNNKRKRFDLFFLCKELDLTVDVSENIYIAALTYFNGASQNVKDVMEEIGFCRILCETAMILEELYLKLCETNFIEVGMLNRLGTVQPKHLKNTSNPFVQVFLLRNMSLFSNLEKASSFINQDLPKIKYISEYLRKGPEMTEQQKTFSNILYGFPQKSLIHIKETDKKTLVRLSDVLKTFQIPNDNEMRDQLEDFQDVNYSQFPQDLQISGEEFLILQNLKKIRSQSICEVRETLRDAERRRYHLEFDNQ